jgi:uncharacterized protein YndB with AHSA1/START domain
VEATTADGPGLFLRVERRFAAPCDRVFRAFAEPQELRRWWGPRGFSAPSLDVDPRPGRRYRIAMQPPEGDVFHLTGTFVDVDPPGRLAFTFRWEEPDPDDRDTVVAVALDEFEGGTLLTVIHGLFATEDRRGLHHRGWSESLERLDEVLSAAG